MRKAALILCGALVLSAAGAASFDPARIAGRYSHHFKNGLVDGTAYWSDDVLEIVKLDPRRAYVRAQLEFYNGHQCGIFGIAHTEPGGLVYRARKPDPGSSQCVLRISETRGGVRLDDGGSCRAYCGARGTLSGVGFSRASRRPITYLERLKRSSEYRAALAEEKGETGT